MLPPSCFVFFAENNLGFYVLFRIYVYTFAEVLGQGKRRSHLNIYYLKNEGELCVCCVVE